MRPLFVAGCQRSGTTAFADYLNQHQQILLCRERYRHMPRKITPSFFAFERILQHDEEVTERRREYHVKLLKKKDPAKLKWIGDKAPRYVRLMKVLLKNNPGARFIVLHRPVEEIAESFEARARDPQDHWPSQNGFELGVRNWNRALRLTREFLEDAPNREVLIVDYHDFFRGNEACISLISGFLELEFDETVREAWKRISLRFKRKRRPKEPLSEEQRSFVEANKDLAAEKWILDLLGRQYDEFGKSFAGQSDRPADRQRAG